MFLLSSPITLKELRPLLRSRKAFWLTLLVLLLEGGAIAFSIWQLSSRMAANFLNVSERVMLGRTIFLGLSTFMLCAIGLISPIITATAITAEREANTLDLLVNTGLSRSRILLGKLAASLTYQILLVILTLPILALPLQFGGVAMDEIIFAALMIALTAVVYGMVGLAVSAMMRKSVAALAVTLSLVLLPTILVPLMVSVRYSDYRTLVRAGSPFFTLEISAEQRIRQNLVIIGGSVRSGAVNSNALTIKGFSDLLATPLVSTHLAIQGAVFLGAWLVAIRGLRRRKAERVAVARKVIHDPTILERRRKRWPYYLVDPLRSEQVIADGQNPVYVKERRVGILSRPDPLIRCCYVGGLISVIFCIFNIADNEVVPLPALALWLITPLGLVCLTQGAASVAREREALTLDLLTATPLAPRQVIRAKFRAIMRFVFFITLSLLAVPALMMPVLYGGTFLTRQAFKMDLGLFVQTFLTLIEAMMFSLAYCSLYTALGIYCSTRCRRALTAIVSSFSIAVVINYIMPTLVSIALSMLHYNLHIDRYSADITIICSILSPYYYFLIDSLLPRSARYFYLDWHSWWLGLLQALLILSMAYLTLRLAARRLALKARG